MTIMNEFDIKHYTLISDNKQNAFWYQGAGTIIAVIHKDHKIEIEPRGEIELIVDDEKYKNEEAVELAIKEGWDDEDIDRLMAEGVFQMNNWLVGINAYDEDSDDLFIQHDVGTAIDDAMELLKTMADGK